MTIAIPCHLQLSVTLRRDKGAMLDVGIIAKGVDDIIVLCSFHNLEYTPHRATSWSGAARKFDG